LPENTSFGGNRIHGLQLGGVRNAMVDHVSIAFCSSSLVALHYSSNVTVQNSALTHPRGRLSGDYVSCVSGYDETSSSSTGGFTVFLLFENCAFVF